MITQLGLLDHGDDAVVGQPDARRSGRRLCRGFESMSRPLRRRRSGRPTLEMNDELDVQNLVHALLVDMSGSNTTWLWHPTYG